MLVICFISQWMNRSKHGLFVFPPKKTLTWKGIVRLDNHVAVSRQSEVSVDFLKVLGNEVFLPERSLNQLNTAFVCICSINQSNRSISVRLLFLFWSRVFISRSYENRSIREGLELEAWVLQARRSNRSAMLPPQKRSKCRGQSLISPWNSFYLACTC